MTDNTAPELFREEVLKQRRQRLYGDVILYDSRLNGVLVLAVGGISSALVIWAATATYPRTEKVPGVVMTTQPSAKVFAVRSGVAEKIYVEEGAIVKRAQPLALIEVDIRDHESNGAAKVSLTAIDHQIRNVNSQIAASGYVLGAERTRLLHALDSNRAESISVSEQAEIQQAIVNSKSKELERIFPAAEKGFISRIEMERKHQALLIERQRLEQIRQQSVQLASRNSDIASQLRRLPMQALREKAELQNQIGSISLQRARAKVEVGYTILAPISGRVTALQAARGRSVDPRIPILAITPERPSFYAQLYAPSKAVGFIRMGQRVRIAYDAFPFKQFGTFSGEVSSISRTAYAPNEIDVPIKLEEPVYIVTVRLSREIIKSFGSTLPLQSGMTLTGTIILERRTFVDWLLQPLNAVRKRT